MRFTRNLLYLVGVFVGAAFAQDRVPSTINWDAVQRAQHASEKDTIEAVRSSVPDAGQLDSVRMPVLLPAPKVVRSAPRLRDQQTSYSALFALDRAKLTIAGSSTSLVEPKAVQAPPVGADDVFEVTDDGADLSITRFGASYVLRVSCQVQADERCQKPAFLRSVADSLVPAGGRKQ